MRREGWSPHYRPWSSLRHTLVPSF